MKSSTISQRNPASSKISIPSTGKQREDKTEVEPQYKMETMTEQQQMDDDDDWALGWTLWTAHRAIAGIANVPSDHSDKKLVNWVQRQKVDYERFTQGKSTFLSSDGFRMLSRMGFTWEIPNARVAQAAGNCDDFFPSQEEPVQADDMNPKPSKACAVSDEEDWDSHFQELIEYHEKHGTVNIVPHRTDLGKWVKRLVGYFEDYIHGKPSPLTSERVKLLDALKFSFMDSMRKQAAHRKLRSDPRPEGNSNENVQINYKDDERKPPARNNTGGKATDTGEQRANQTVLKHKREESIIVVSNKKPRRPAIPLNRTPTEHAMNKNDITDNVDTAHSRPRRSTRSVLTPVVNHGNSNGEAEPSRDLATTLSDKDKKAHPTRRARTNVISETTKSSRQKVKHKAIIDDETSRCVESSDEDATDALAAGQLLSTNTERKDLSDVIQVRGVVIMTEQEYERLLVPNEPQVSSKNCSQIQADRNKSWHLKFCSLVEFKRLNGHVCVAKVTPKLDPALRPLSVWVYQIRQQKREHSLGIKNALNKARLQKLADVGFEWNTRRSLQFWHNMAETSNSAAWEHQFQELLEYKANTGTCLVPKVFPEKPRLSYWVARQRAQMRMKRLGKNHSLTPGREKRLIEVGFVFNTKSKEIRRFNLLRRYSDQWDDHFDRLQKFKAKYGHTWVPKRYPSDMSLAGWVGRLRSLFRRRLGGEDNTLSDDRMKKLVALDFMISPTSSDNSPVVIRQRSNESAGINNGDTDSDEIIGSQRKSSRIQSINDDFEEGNSDEIGVDDRKPAATASIVEIGNVKLSKGVVPNPGASDHTCNFCKQLFDSFLAAMAHEAHCSGFTDKMRNSKK